MSWRGFWLDIAEHPDDDALRLILSDWLEDHGDEAQAEFIRVQLRRSRLPLDDPEQPALARREAELLARYSARWAGDLALYASDWVFRRGLIEGVHVWQLAPLLEYLPEHPLPLRSLQWERLGELRRLDDLAVLGTLREMGACYVSMPAQELELVLHSEHLRSLRRLHLQAVHLLGPLTVELVLQAPWVSQLEYLNLSMNQLTVESVRLLTQTPTLSQLRELVLSCNELIGNQGVLQLLRSPLGEQLRLLEVTNTNVTGPGVRQLANLPQLAGLEGLRLGNNDLGGSGAEALLQSPHLSGLRQLDLSSTRIGLRGLRALSERPALPQLEELKLNNALPTLEALRILLRAPTLRSLQRLDLGNNPMLDERGVRLLVEQGPWPWRVLDLRACQLGDAGVEALTASPCFPQLHTLILHANRLGSAAARALAHCPHLPRLRILGLNNNYLDAAAACALAGSPYLDLCELQVAVNPLSNDDQKLLRERFGGCVRD